MKIDTLGINSQSYNKLLKSDCYAQRQPLILQRALGCSLGVPSGEWLERYNFSLFLIRAV